MEHVSYNDEFAGYVHEQGKKKWSYAFPWAPTTWMGIYTTKKAAKKALMYHLSIIGCSIKKIFNQETHRGKTE
jgi:hypothetical protein